MKKDLIAIAEEFLTKEHNIANKTNKKFVGISFMQIWQEIIRQNNFDKKESDGLIGDFYSELMQNPKFVNMGNNKWRLKEFTSFEEYKKIKNAIYGIENLERIEEEQRNKNTEEKLEPEIKDDDDKKISTEDLIISDEDETDTETSEIIGSDDEDEVISEPSNNDFKNKKN